MATESGEFKLTGPPGDGPRKERPKFKKSISIQSLDGEWDIQFFGSEDYDQKKKETLSRLKRGEIKDCTFLDE